VFGSAGAAKATQPQASSSPRASEVLVSLIIGFPPEDRSVELDHSGWQRVDW